MFAFISNFQIKNWTLAKQKPGMFTGSTGIKLLRPEELANSNPTKQAWAKKVWYATPKDEFTLIVFHQL